MSKFSKKMLAAYRENKKSTIAIYLILRILVILCMILEMLRGEINNVLLCFLSLVLFTLPTFIESKFRIKLPDVFEIIVYFFIFSAEILGEINNFYGIIPFWDTMLHTINGFLAAGVGYSLFNLLNKNSKHIKLSPAYLSLVAFCFSMTIGVVWEFFEYTMDKVFLVDMQKDQIVDRISSVSLDPEASNRAIVVKDINKTILYDSNDNVLTVVEGGYLDIGINDTMKDLVVNFIGAFVFSVFGCFYTINSEKHALASNFIIVSNEK